MQKFKEGDRVAFRAPGGHRHGEICKVYPTGEEGTQQLYDIELDGTILRLVYSNVPETLITDRL